MANQGRTRPSVWITYAWVDDAEGDFSYLVGELEAAGMTTSYDRVALVPGRRLWDQIANQIARPDLSGWPELASHDRGWSVPGADRVGGGAGAVRPSNLCWSEWQLSMISDLGS